jgi:hypothetical protein
VPGSAADVSEGEEFATEVSGTDGSGTDVSGVAGSVDDGALESASDRTATTPLVLPEQPSPRMLTSSAPATRYAGRVRLTAATVAKPRAAMASGHRGHR